MMNKIFVVTGTRYSTDVEIWHTRTDLFHNIIGIYSTKKHADEIAEQIGRSRESNYFPESIDKDMIEELTKEQKQAKLAEWSCKMDVLTVMLNAIEDDLENRLSNQFKFREFNEFKDEFSNLVFEFNQLDLKLKLTQMH